MKIEPFKLERWFAQYEHKADIMLAESGIRSLKAERFDFDLGSINYVIPTNGDPKLRATLGKRYDRSAEEILFTCGTQEANLLLFLALLSDEDHAIAITPTYQALHSVPEAVGTVSRVWLEPPEWKLDVEQVKEAIRPNTKLIVLNNPNNPTGKYHSQEKVKALYEIAEENDAFLLCDEVYRMLAKDPLPPVASMGEHGISTSSLTKVYGLAGTRFGWIAAPKEVIEEAWQWKDFTTISPSIFGQHIAKQVFYDMEEEILSENRELANKNREIVEQFVDKHGLDWHYPVGVNGFVKIPNQFPSSKAFCKRIFEEKRLVLAPGSVFGYPKYFRIGFGQRTEVLKKGLSRISTFLQESNS